MHAMKKTWPTLLLSLTVVALLVPGTGEARPSTTREVIAGYMAAWNAHDVEKAASFLAEDVEYFDASVGTPQQGRENAKNNIIKVFITAVPDLKWVIDGEPILDKNGIAFRWTLTGNNTGAWDEKTPATGKPFTLKGVSYVRLSRDGKIRYQGDYYDALGFHKQLGWLQ